MKSFNCIFDDNSSLLKFIEANQIQNSDKVLVQIFSGICDEALLLEIVNAIKTKLPNSTIIGSTTDGEIINAQVTIKQVVISFSVFDDTSIVSAFAQLQNFDDSFEVGQEIMRNLVDANPKVVISFANAASINGEEYVNGIYSIKNDMVLSGGLAGDNGTFERNLVFLNDKFTTNGAVAVALSGEKLNVANNYSLNWQPLGKWLKVTKSNKNRVYEIDGISATQLYGKYLGKDIAKYLPKTGVEFPLIIKNDNITISRAVLSKHDDGSLTFAGNVNEGDFVRFAYGNVEMILNNVDDNIKFFSNYFVESIFVYSCMARRRLFGNKAFIEIAPLSNIASVSGFYTYGEFYSSKSDAQLLNETMTILALSEGDGHNQNKETHWDFDYESNSNILAIKALTHLVAVSTTEIEELYKESKHKDEMMFNQSRLASMGEMIGNIAHQWRQPLSALTMIVQHIQLVYELGTLDEEFLKNQVDEAMKIASYMSNTIDDFRNFFKPNTKKNNFYIKDVISKVENFIKSMLLSNHIKLNLPTADCDYKICSYESMFFQVLITIINNSKDAFSAHNIQNRTIDIELDCFTDKVVLKVIDNAGGIDEAIVNKIFEPYFTTKHQAVGTGLGLYIAKTIVEQHMQGNIAVFGNNNGGTTFCITIPK